MSMFDKQRVCCVFCTPMPTVGGPGGAVLETISVRWQRHRAGLRTPTNFNSSEMFVDGLEVGDARSRVAAHCLAMTLEPEFLFFLDYDVLVPPDALTKLFFRARMFPHYDVYAGVYCLKSDQHPEPLVYGDHGQGPVWDWAVGDLLTTESHGVKSVHMGLTLIRVAAFRRLKELGLVHGDGTNQADEPFFKTTESVERVSPEGTRTTHQGTEDIWFCDKLVAAGGKILVDTSVLAGHENKHTGRVYGLPYGGGPTAKAHWLTQADGTKPDQEKAKVEDGMVLCVCEGGNVRSVAAAYLLKHEFGRDAVSAGWRFNSGPTLEALCESAAAVIVMQDEIVAKIPERFRHKVSVVDVGPDRFGTPFHDELQTTLREKLGAWVAGNTRPGRKLALDIGAGPDRREWPGHLTYTTDIRADVGADYVQDTRLLNLPDDHFDLTASSHHLEHLGRFDQEAAWASVFRVTKPGGRTEHVLPNVAWAAEKIAAGEVDPHVYNVLYGSQEMCRGIAREYNSHHFGYTPAVAKALAETAGFVDVTVEDYRDRPEMGYNLIVRGTKPGGVAVDNVIHDCSGTGVGGGGAAESVGNTVESCVGDPAPSCCAG